MTTNFKISTTYTKASARIVIDILENYPVKVEELKYSRPLALHEQPLDQGERSFKEVLVHLINCEARASEAILAALTKSQPQIVKIHPEKAYGKWMQFHRFAFDELLPYFTLRRKALVRLFHSLSDADWVLEIKEERKKRRETVYLLARSMALHENEHLAWVESKFAKITSAG